MLSEVTLTKEDQQFKLNSLPDTSATQTLRFKHDLHRIKKKKKLKKLKLLKCCRCCFK